MFAKPAADSGVKPGSEAEKIVSENKPAEGTPANPSAISPVDMTHGELVLFALNLEAALRLVFEQLHGTKELPHEKAAREAACADVKA